MCFPHMQEVDRDHGIPHEQTWVISFYNLEVAGNVELIIGNLHFLCNLGRSDYI